MNNELQELVDDLSDTLGRSVVLDDKRLGLLAYSARQDDVDSVRAEAILHREIPGPVLSWLRTTRIDHAVEPTFVPPQPELRLKGRICIPVRHGEALVGYMWLIAEHEHELEGEALAQVLASAAAAAAVIDREETLRRFASSRERELVAELVSSEEPRRLDAAAQLLEQDFLDTSAPLTAIVARLPDADEGGSASARRLTLESAATRVRRTLAPRAALHLTDTCHAALLIAAHGPAAASIDGVAQRLHDAVAETGDAPVVGIGPPAVALADAHRSYACALRAAAVGAQIPSLGPVVRWEQLGVYQLLSDPGLAETPLAEAHPGLARLLAADANGTLTDTLEAYLDLGGDGRALTERLAVHRATLYYRLNRAFELAGVEMRDGEGRLYLHLMLKLARLRGWR